MKHSLFIFLTIMLSTVLTTGCWDSTELNDRAFWAASGWDIGKNGAITLSGEFVIPLKVSGGGSTSGGDGKGFFLVDAQGKTSFEALELMQTKLTRKMFLAHRQSMFFSEKIARRGLQDVLDTVTRSPDVRLRSAMFVVKNGSAEDALNLTSPIDRVPGVAAVRERAGVKRNGGLGFFQFLDSATSDSMCPTIPAGEVVPLTSLHNSEETGSDKGFQIVGTAVFNKKLKLVGFLNSDESSTMYWVRDNLKTKTLTDFIPQGNGYVSMELTKLKSVIRPVVKKNKVEFNVYLSCSGMIKENNTSLDLSRQDTIHTVESVLDNETTHQVLEHIHKVQNLYGTDIYGFGEVVHRKYPYKWKELKGNWSNTFSHAQVNVYVTIKVRQIGLSGRAIHSK